MKCPNCDAVESRVLETRSVQYGEETMTKRRRQCEACGERFSTYESYEPADLESAFRIREALAALERVRITLTETPDRR